MAHHRTFCRHLQLTRKNGRLVSSPALYHGLASSIFSSDFGVVFCRFSFHDNFYLQSHTIKERCALGIMIKHNSNERDTQSIDTLKHLTEIVVVVDLLSRGSTYTHCWIN